MNLLHLFNTANSHDDRFVIHASVGTGHNGGGYGSNYRSSYSAANEVETTGNGDFISLSKEALCWGANQGLGDFWGNLAA
ncbi:MAG: hypothetical protein AB7S38_02740 [Vulcanimicrobiota bacterium]